MESFRGKRQTFSSGQIWSTLLSAILIISAGCLDSLVRGQPCGSTQSTPLRVENETLLDTLRTAVSCTDGGAIEVSWAGFVTLDAPITIADGTFLSVTGEDDQAEMHGDDSSSDGTRLFVVSPGGGLTLTRLKLSAGAAAEGGAIHLSSAFLTLDSCVFDGNIATEGSGGAVWANGGNVTIMGGEFSGNSASQLGGAVHATDGRLEVQGGCRFEGNEASVGGALFCGSATEGSATSPVLCSIMDTEFTSNKATYANINGAEDATSSLDGGGAAAFHLTDATVTNSVFSGNYARISGGALYGGPSTSIAVNGCTFGNNTSEQDGGAISASSIRLGEDTHLANNSASSSGGAVFGWDASGTITFNDMLCTNNSAEEYGGCFHGSGKGVFNNGTVMLDNHAEHGGSIYAGEGSDIDVNGGQFTCRTSARGGFLYAEDNTDVKITGGLVADNVSTRRGGAVYCSGNGVSTISIEGGIFRDNSALEAGGAIAIGGSGVLVTITGGTFESNTAAFFGGFAFIEIEASITCVGAIIRGNFAGEQGGGIYAREATSVNSSCDLIANESPQGAAIYLLNVKSATLENHKITDNLALSGSAINVVESSVVAKGVTFGSSVGLQAYSSNRAIQLDERTTLNADKCVFDGWLGDTVVFNLNSANGSLVLNSCDFSGCFATMAVVSPNSDAEIRNAIASSVMLKNAVGSTLNNSLALVDRALDCSDPNACGVGDCVDSLLGVLCECLEGGECLNDGGELSLSLKTPAQNETFSPDTVSYELLVSSAFNGTSFTIWDLEVDEGDLDLVVVPSSGVLPPGGSTTVTVTGTPSKQDVGGDLVSSFSLAPVGSASVDSTGVGKLKVISTFYLCRAFAYARPQYGDDPNGISCEQCATIEGEKGVDCDSPGATLASLPIMPGYWRSSNESLVVRQCLHPDACLGGKNISRADDYCADGYNGPYCAVCSDGYGRGGGNSCHRCDNTKAHLLIAISTFFGLVVLLLFLLAVVFLIGGLDAIVGIRQSAGRTVSMRSKAHSTRISAPVQEYSLPRRPIASSAHSFAVRVSNRGGGSVGGSISGSSGVGGDSGGNGGSGGGGGGGISGSGVGGGGTDGIGSGVRDGGGGGGGSISGSGGGSGGGWAGSGRGGGGGRVGGGTHGHSKVLPMRLSGLADTDWTFTRDLGRSVGVESGAQVSDEMGMSPPRNVGTPAGQQPGRSVVPGSSTGGARTATIEEVDASENGEPAGCAFGDKVKRFVARLPLNKLKILVVVWQILALFSGITGVEFPAAYSRFLSWISFVNLDIGRIFSASCVLPSANFYVSLLVTTLVPLVLALGLVLTYQTAKRRAGVGLSGVTARKAAWSRHMAAGLLLTFLMFTSASTVVLKTFACDNGVVYGQSYLRADYSISCGTNLHMFFRVYAGILLLVYPVGVPVLYAVILWRKRYLLNPRIHVEPDVEPDGADEAGADEAATRADLTGRDETLATSSKDKTKNIYRYLELQEKQVKARNANPSLVSSKFLWKDFGPDFYYFEVIDCSRRISLTGLLLFIAPHSATQAATASLFAFACLLGFEVMRPHTDPTDTWLYRLGCVIIFMTNFLALLIKVDIGSDSSRAAFGVLLVVINVLVALAVIGSSWFTGQQAVNASSEEGIPSS